MRLQGDRWRLELSEAIRLNQLIRARIDLDGFMVWYQELTPPQQCGLIYTLAEFAGQAGGGAAELQEAITHSGLTAHPVSEPIITYYSGKYIDLYHLEELILRLDDADRLAALQLFVYLFGLAEGRCYRRETKESCNHWWHRDLLDERVVEDLLSNERYFMTSMKDDERLLQGKRKRMGWPIPFGRVRKRR